MATDTQSLDTLCIGGIHTLSMGVVYARLRSGQEHIFAEKVLSAMRQKFSGHVERVSGGSVMETDTNFSTASKAVGLACLIVLLATTAWADEFPVPKVEYSADVTMDLGTRSSGTPMIMKGKVYSAKSKERREVTVEQHQSVFIMDRNNKTAWILMPQRKMYMVAGGKGKEQEDPERMIREGDVKLTKLGSESVNGVATTKYRMVVTSKLKDPFEGLVWITSDNIPVRMESASNDSAKFFRIDYTNLKVGKQDPALFEIPAGYQEMKMPTFPGMDLKPGAGGSSGGPAGEVSEEQAVQMRKQLEDMMKQIQ